MSVFEALQKLFPDFGEARRKRRSIRKEYRDRLNSIKRNEGVEAGTRLAVAPQYLGDRAEQKFTRVNHLIQEYGSISSSRSYRIKDNQDEVEEAIDELISAITLRNWISIGTEIVFIVFVVGALATSLFLGLVGVDAIASAI
ncbi:hypothetical protein [Halorubrum distributum]|uniref:hypothetical protein n=1 Tax=Halorubrum distributum TaxID=29283 RepID=UPI001268E048|nr:hypothetical protein [Halorubrum arcis]